MQHFDFKPEGKNFGIIGKGNVGTRVKRVAESFGMNTLISDPPLEDKNTDEQFDSLEEVLKKSDFITIHVPYTKTGKYPTAYLINKDTLSLMKKGAWIINSSRGGIIQEDDLKVELDNKRIEAVLDVWENEPTIDLDLMNKCVLATSHIAGYSVDGKANGTTRSVNHIAEDFKLNLKNWQAQDLPKSNLVIQVGQGDEGLIKAIQEAYDISDDNQKIKSNPETFEVLRGTYEPRRDLSEISFVGDENNCKKLKAMMIK